MSFSRDAGAWVRRRVLARSLWVEADAVNHSLWDGDETVAVC